MIPNPVKFWGFFSNSLLIRQLPKSIWLNSATFGSIAASQALYDFQVQETVGDLVELNSRDVGATSTCHSEEHHEIYGHYPRTYTQLIDGYQKNSGSLIEAKKLQGKIFKLGFHKDGEITNWLIDIYFSTGDLVSVLLTLDGFPCRNLSFWNKLITGYLRRRSSNHVFQLFSQMLVENVCPDAETFSAVLRAGSASKVAFYCIEQVHAQVVRYGFATNLLVCNPLIDLYSKNGFVDSAKQIFVDMHFRDSVSWVAMISGFSHNGREEDGILLYNEMRRSGIIPTPYIFSNVISACSKAELYGLGEQLHAIIYKWGFSLETFVCNSLVTLYSRCGDLISAEQIFSTMQQRDKVSYNSLISGLVQKGYTEKSFQLFDKMQNDCLQPDCVTVASLLSACASVGALDKGKQLHSYAIKAGMCTDIILEGSLLDLYVKCSDVETAHNYFLATRKDNIVLWNVMLVAYGMKGDLNKSCQIFVQMQVQGLQPNQYTYPSILKTCTLVGALDLGEQLHSHIIKSCFHPNVYVSSVLIDFYAKHGKFDAATKILRCLTEEDVVSWTALIAGYAQHDFFIEALALFIEMQDRGVQSDSIGLSSAMSACSGIKALNQGRQLHAKSIISGYTRDLSINNALSNLYARCGKVQEAYYAFDKNEDKDSSISWNGLISGFAQSSNWEEAVKIFSQMNEGGIEANMFTYGSVVSAAANTTNIKLGKQIHAKMMKTGYDTEIEASNVLITLYAKCGSLGDARREFLEMPQKNEVSWNAMITGYSQHGRGHDAIKLFEDMKQREMKPNHVTFLGVLSACSHVGLVDEGLSYFNSLSEKHGIVPKPEHYACVVDILGRAGYLGRAREFVKAMPIEPDAMIWRTLLSSCTVHKNMEIGEWAAQHLLQLEPEDSASYVLLANMYAVSGIWDYRDCTRKLMKDRGVKKEPGRSWLEVKNTVHAFFVGDRLHPLAEQIYQFLEDLNVRVSAIGYVQDQHSLWNDLEQAQKDPTAFVHSEKLAIAFGLMSLSDAIPLHIMKNLRICNDCHNWIKFVSRVTNRAIVVRDAYRFHHFKDCICSCRDYW